MTTPTEIEALPTATEAALCCMIISNPGGGERPHAWQKRVNDLIRAQCDALTALQAERDDQTVKRAEKAEEEREKDHAEINLKADFIDKTINQLAAAQVDREALIELCQEVSFFLKAFSVGKPVYADRLKSALDNARAALVRIKGA
jgi:hypothetical protein